MENQNGDNGVSSCRNPFLAAFLTFSRREKRGKMGKKWWRFIFLLDQKH